jgi:ribosomal protein S18 acetylase RimI-like enzyme
VEFTTGGRLEVSITAADVGKRVSVRRLTEAGGDARKFTDTVGVLTSWSDGVLKITRRNGEAVRVAESSLVAGKVVPPAPVRRKGPSAHWRELDRVAARAWPPVVSERLGEWELRWAGGFTRRANSVLPLGDPGMPLEKALRQVVAWYAERGLPAYIQLSTGAEGAQEQLAAELAARGWVREVSAQVRTAVLAEVADRAESAIRKAPGGITPAVVLSRAVDERWLARYQRCAEPVPEVLKVVGGGPSVWFAAVPGQAAVTGDDAADARQDPSPRGAAAPSEAAAGDPARIPTAIGRCVVDGRWAGFTAVEVAPARRRQGLALAVTAALARRALDQGASAAYLQVEEDNRDAGAFYDALSFTTHHTYHHWRAPMGDVG